ncbi:Arylsulfatase A [Rubritalea squalenifaciens DSM 18772]|uniref:Arylsulfatase A n=1 Tax=Rubritalea squalenifaciens DSM 18772 TaxID=1123071 RepID=A0A1M6BG12_9BACT|nr:sulfatase-like hydrolase/transferase [Rubritalea squalenifaciens]SHI47649.1 Arylsulfatase A [Rubritalea squalenifaciens DSM 18772]
MFKLLTTFLCLSLTASALEKPNIILVMTDDQGWGDVSYHGHPHLKTPNIDALAAEGMKLERFYAQSAVCSPTRGSALTGRHPDRYGIYYANVGHMLDKELTLAELLKEQGYATGHFGKWHLGTMTNEIKDANRGGVKKDEFSPPWKHGFERCFSTESKVPTWDPMLVRKQQKDKRFWNAIREGEETEFYNTRYWTEDGKPVDPASLRGCDSKHIMDHALQFVDEHGGKKPFFMVIWFHAPHWPVVAGPEYAAMYEGHSDFEKNYWGCITAVDDQMGRLKKALADKGLANTMLFYASDNGPEGNAAPKAKNHGIGTAKDLSGRKRSLKEGGIRVPGFLYWPAKIKPGQVSQMATCTSDYFPTVVDVLDLNPSPQQPIDGVSLLPLIEGKTEQRTSPLGFAIQKQIAWMDGQWKAYSPDGGKSWSLYDLIKDPSESTDLSKQHPEKLLSMKEQAMRWKSGLRNP